MKFQLTINSDDPNEIKRAIDFFNGSTAISGAMPVTGTNTTSMPGASADDGDNEPENNNAPAYDSAGIPWDVRIHSKNKGLNADSTWRKKRGVTAEMITAVEAELKSRGAQTMMMPQTMMQPAPQQPAPQMQPNVQHQQPQQFQPQPNVQMPHQQPQQFQPQPNVQQPAQPQPLDFNTFMQRLSVQMNTINPASGGPFVDQPYLISIVQRVNTAFQTNCNVITDFINNPNALQYAVQLMQTEGRW